MEALGELIPDPREFYVTTIGRALETLCNNVIRGTVQTKRLRRFACDLKTSDMFERAQQVIDQILSESPDDEDALELRASIWNFQDRYEDAAALAGEILKHNPRNTWARRTLIRAYEGLKDWTNVLEAANESLQWFEDIVDRNGAIESRCLAYWNLGRIEESDEDLRTLQISIGGPYKVKRIMRLRGTPLKNQAIDPSIP